MSQHLSNLSCLFEVSQANQWMNWVCPNICSLVLLQYRSRTYWDHGHSDAHDCEHGGGHRAALIGELDAVVIAEESSLVRREGRFVQKHGNEQHCMVWTHTSRSQTALWTSIDIINRETHRKAHNDRKSQTVRNSEQTCIQVSVPVFQMDTDTVWENEPK